MIEQVAGDIRYWHLTDLPVLHDHVRLARQSGNHLNLLSISADDPQRTSIPFEVYFCGTRDRLGFSSGF
jgi:hypothetical protein